MVRMFEAATKDNGYAAHARRVYERWRSEHDPHRTKLNPTGDYLVWSWTNDIAQYFDEPQ